MSATPHRSVGNSAIGTPAHFRWLLGIVKAVLVLNVVDAMFTIGWVWFGFGAEANPVLARQVAEQPVWFAVAKLSLVGLGTLLLWRYRQRPLAVIAIFAIFVVYYGIAAYHIGFLGQLLAPLW